MTPYHYVANNPMLFIDPTGEDYVLYVNHENNSITIKATYYTETGDQESYESALLAINVWNNQNGNLTYKVGNREEAVEYSVNFDLNVKQVDEPLKEANRDKMTFVDDSEKTTPDGSSNVYELVKDDNSSVHGVTKSGNHIQVEESDAKKTTGGHEIGHTLGLGHSMSGIMTEGINHPSHTGKPIIWDNKNIIQNAYKSKTPERVIATGSEPRKFKRGKIIRK